MFNSVLKKDIITTYSMYGNFKILNTFFHYTLLKEMFTKDMYFFLISP